MRVLIRLVLSALAITVLSVSVALTGFNPVLAQSKEVSPQPVQTPEIKQMALTEKQIQGVLSAQKDIDVITAALPDNAKPDPNVMTKLEAVARKNGFASYEEYSNVIDNIGLVLSGFDPTTKKYVGSEAVIKAQIAQVEADKKMSAADKKQALADLNAALKSPEPPIEHQGNIDLVAKYYDQLADLMGDDQN